MQTSKSGGRWGKQLLRENVNVWNALSERLPRSKIFIFINFKDKASVHGGNKIKPPADNEITFRDLDFFRFRGNDERQKTVNMQRLLRGWMAAPQGNTTNLYNQIQLHKVQEPYLFFFSFVFMFMRQATRGLFLSSQKTQVYLTVGVAANREANSFRLCAPFWQSYEDSLRPENADRLLFLAKNLGTVGGSKRTIFYLRVC